MKNRIPTYTITDAEQIKKYAEDIADLYKSEKDKRGKLEAEIKKREEVEKNLIRANNKIESLLSSIVSILIGVSTRDKIIHWNHFAENVFGISSADVVDHYFTQCGIDWQWDRICEGISQCIIEQRPVFLDDIYFRRIDGTNGFLGIKVNPIMDYMNNLDGFLLFGADITERKILETQLLQAQKLESIGQLAAGVAHEINTPVQYVTDNTFFLEDSCSEISGILLKNKELMNAFKNEKVKDAIIGELFKIIEDVDLDYLINEIPKAIAQSKEGLQRIAKIVASMKQFSHPGTEYKMDANINNVLESVITMSRNEWKYVADLKTDFDESLPMVKCHSDDLSQVFLNIIVNAAHAIEEVIKDDSDKEGTIFVSTGKVGDSVEIRIKDTGCGIPESIQSRIFDPFFTTKDVGKGTGQGLALSHSIIVNKHGGSISINSENGKGAEFIIRLPIEGD